MAEKGAHLTGTAFNRPTIFEIIAQESLASTLEPGFKRILSFIVSFNSERYEHILKWEDECYLLFNLFLQKYYLKKYSASFSETFYGLKRIVVGNSKLKEELSSKQWTLSLISLVAIPYIKNKLAQLSLKYQLDDIDGCAPQERWRRLFRQYLVKGHSIFYAIYKSVIVYNYVLYASEESMYSSPLLKLLRITLTYSQPVPSRSILDVLRKIMYSSFTLDDGWDIFVSNAARLLELSAFFLQFLSWWNQENHNTDIMNLPAPSPPKISKAVLQYKGICPLCRKSQHIHTVLMVSGFVFCYQCILLEIRKNRRCPITLYPATEDDLVRLYIN